MGILVNLEPIPVQRMGQVATVSYTDRKWKVVLDRVPHPSYKVDPEFKPAVWERFSPLRRHDVDVLDEWLDGYPFWQRPEFKQDIYKAICELLTSNLLVLDRSPI